MFAYSMKWDDPMMAAMCHRRKNLQMCMYTIHLATGNSLWCRRIKAGTIKQYVLDVARFLARAGEHPIDPRKTLDQTGMDPTLQNIYKELERWEKVPDRREPFTAEMLAAMSDTATFGQHAPDSSWAACQDWFHLGLRLGLRLSEWAQNDGASLSSPARDIYDDAKAFCLNDFRFELKNRRRLTGAAVLEVPVEDLRKCWVKFRTQKNGENGEEKILTKQALAIVYRIIQRFVALRGSADTTTPLAIFKDPATGQAQFITASIIESTMRTLAAHVYQLDPVKDRAALQLWSAHSLRVGACVILHTMGFTGSQIKFLLRWKSDAFLTYLRNVALMSDRQDEAIDRAAAMPDLF